MNRTGGNKIAIGIVLIIIAVLSRLLPHWHNFTAVGAVGLFGAFYFRKQVWAFLVPLMALWISDLVLNNWVYSAYHPEFVWFTQYMIFVYIGMMALIITGQTLLGKFTGSRVLTASILASLIFFLISNFGSFLFDPMYPKDISGLSAAYLAGIPFFWNTLMANVIYSLIIFGLFYWASLRFPSLRIART